MIQLTITVDNVGCSLQYSMMYSLLSLGTNSCRRPILGVNNLKNSTSPESLPNLGLKVFTVRVLSEK